MKDEKLTFWQLLILGFQHVCVMYGGAVAVPLIIAPAIGLTQQQLVYLISFDLFTCGVATLIQVIGFKGVGIKLPAMMAISFTVVQPVIAIGQIHSITGVFGAVIVSGLIVAIAAQFVGKVLPYFPHLVTGAIVFIIGVSLMPVAMNNAAGGVGAEDFGSMSNLGLALATLLLFLIFNMFLKGFLKAVSVLFAMALGTLIASFMGKVDGSIIGQSDWVTPIKPFYFGMPTFDIPSIITMTVIAMIIMIESIGVFMALGEISKQHIGDYEVKKGLRAEGLGAVFSGVFNSFNHSTFSQNVGLVFLTGVTNRFVVAMGGVILLLLGLLPKVAAVATMIPAPVLGGAMIPMFGMLIAASLRIIAQSDLSKPSNQLIIAVGVGVGLAIKGVPGAFEAFPDTAKMLVGNGVVMGTLVLFVLNLVLNGKGDNHSHEANEEENLQELETDKIEAKA
ncbi:nucleobase:cation symporter-2 family protein [Metabacillus fastidiosus]|uniref:nucleobase:cation symporter-2 family protein n=1 Tax=Metabacillus fastidiosus TaxID=1458 RepID=UPI003D2D7AA0